MPKFKNINERIAWEDAHAKFEQHELSNFALSKIRQMPKMDVPTLQVAAKLKDHDGELGHVGRAAHYELVIRGLARRS